MPTADSYEVAINQAKISFGENGIVLAEAGKVGPPRQPSTTTDVATTVNGDANAAATNQAQVGILNSSVETGLNGTVTASAVSDLSAKATTTTGKTTARAEYEGPLGAIVDDGQAAAASPDLAPASTSGGYDLQIGKNGIFKADLDATAKATARSITGDAWATADVGQAAGLYDISLKTGEGTSLNVSAKVGLDTKAGLDPADGSANVTGNATAESGKRGEDGTIIAGIYDSGAKSLVVEFGKSASINVNTQASFGATAQTVTGTTKATNAAELIAGIASDSPNSLAIKIGENDPLITKAKLTTDASAATVTGDAQAKTDIGTVAGIVGESTSVTMGLDGTVEASAEANNTAKASSTSADTEVRAQIDNDRVLGIAIDKLSIGKDANSLTSLADSRQSATAKLGGPGDPPNAVAKVASGDVVFGISDTDVAIGENLTENASANLARAILVGTAVAEGVSSPGDVKAKAGVGSQVAGLQGGSLKVGANVLDPNGVVPGTIDAYATSVLNAAATSTAGNAVAKAGSVGMSAQPTSVTGISSTPVSVGLNGKVSGLTSASVGATATSVNSDATAEAGQVSRGVFDSAISIGKSGGVSGVSGAGATPVSGNASSSTTTGNAQSTLDLEGDGIKQLTANIDIGEAGDVVGNSYLAGAASAKAVTGQATTTASLSSDGIDLGSSPAAPITTSSEGGPNIKVGTIGDVAGKTLIGSRDPLTGALKTPISAETTTGDASASGGFDAAGITKHGWATPGEQEAAQTNGRSMIQAGPKGGDITGISEAGGQVSALAVEGMASANTKASLYGIDGSGGLDLQAGLIGSNLVQGKATGAFDTRSLTVTGDANARGDASAFGLLGDGMGKILLSGNVEAMAALTNTVTAMTTTGNAVAEAFSHTVGLSGYDVQILGSGMLTASAMSTTSSFASSVNGSVNAVI